MEIILLESKEIKKIEVFVTPEQHKLNLKDFRFINVDYVINISPDIKTIYVDVGYSVTWRNKVEYKESYNTFARLTAFGGIILGISAVLNTLLQMQINYYNF